MGSLPTGRQAGTLIAVIYFSILFGGPMYTGVFEKDCKLIRLLSLLGPGGIASPPQDKFTWFIEFVGFSRFVG